MKTLVVAVFLIAAASSERNYVKEYPQQLVKETKPRILKPPSAILGTISSGVWVPMKTGDPLPEGAVWAGSDKSGSLYVGRSYEDETAPEAAAGAYVASQGVLVHTYVSRVIQRSEFEILTYNATDQPRLVWVKAESGWIPPRAVLAGVNLETGLEIFIGRWLNQGVYTPGKIYRSTQNILAPCGNFECFSNTYEVLVELDEQK